LADCHTKTRHRKNGQLYRDATAAQGVTGGRAARMAQLTVSPNLQPEICFG